MALKRPEAVAKAVGDNRQRQADPDEMRYKDNQAIHDPYP
jgi:hypothetical protein